MILHPSSVHFPIALLFVSGFCYLMGFFKKREFLFKVGGLLHSIGMIGLLIAVLTGKISSSSLSPNPEVSSLLWQHELMAYGIIWSFGMLWIWQYMRIKALKSVNGAWEKVFFVGIFFLALGFMAYSAYLGGEMVYQHGLGVQVSP